MLLCEIRRIYLPKSNKPWSFYLSYQQRNTDELRLGGRHSYLFATAELAASTYFSVGGSLRIAADPKTQRVTTEGMLDLTTRFEF